MESLNKEPLLGMPAMTVQTDTENSRIVEREDGNYDLSLAYIACPAIPEAIQHLRALVAAGPCHNVDYCDAPEDCIYCGVWLEMLEMHKPDCPYLAAKQFLDKIDAPRASQR